ncbi:HAMP domain-containing sensor histidine kinase [Desulfotomaculum varum]
MKQKIKAGFNAVFTPNSLLSQLLLRSLLILAGLLVLIGLLQYLFMKEVIYRNKAVSLQSQIMSIPRFVWEHPAGSPDDEAGRPQRFFIPEASLAFIDAGGNYVILSHGRGRPPQVDVQEYMAVLKNKFPPDLTTGVEGVARERAEWRETGKKKPAPYYKIVNAGGAEHLVVWQPVFDHGQLLGVVQASTLTGPLKELLIRQLFTFLFLSMIALLVGLLSFSPIIKKTLVPLFNMVDTAEQIDAGNLTKRFPIQQGQLEIDRLAESFNGMLERLEASFAAERQTKEQMRRFIADASHELRTPLTSIHGFLEVLLRGAANQPEQLHKALKSMYGESERLNKLVQDLLLLAKLDRTPRLELADGLLDEVIREMEPQLRLLAGSRRLDLQVAPEVKCRFNADKIKQVILNLFHNAVQHTDPEKGRIVLSLAKQADGVLLTVQDNGPGISAHHRCRIFDRFYRIDISRTRRYGGAGLGLSITKSIVEAHGGTIGVTSQEGAGCTFHVRLPA